MENDQIDAAHSENVVATEPVADTHSPEMSTAITVVAGLSLLTNRVEQLARLCTYFSQENTALQAENAALQDKNTALSDQNAESRARIEMMVVRLKALGQES